MALVKYTDVQIARLVDERKPLASDYPSRMALKVKRGHKERELVVAGLEGGKFRLLLRQSNFNPQDFSIILAVELPDSNQFFRLRRYNGKSHEHTNHIEGDTFYDFHIYYATERYQTSGGREDGYAEATNRYGSIHEALDCMMADCGFEAPEPPQLDLYHRKQPMTLETLEREFRTKVCEKIQLQPEGVDRYRIFTPFLFEDGDHLAIVLKRENGAWSFSDEGHTFMHLSYDIDERDLQRGTRRKVIDNALALFQVEDRDGEFRMQVAEDRFGDALYSFIQALLKVSDVTFLNRERARSTFLDDFRALIEDAVDESKRVFDWRDPVHDEAGNYIVDCRLEGRDRPLFIFALPNDDRVRDTTIKLMQFEKWGLQAQTLGIFEDQESINRKVLARFSDVCEKQFSNLGANPDRIRRYLQQNAGDAA